MTLQLPFNKNYLQSTKIQRRHFHCLLRNIDKQCQLFQKLIFCITKCVTSQALQHKSKQTLGIGGATRLSVSTTAGSTYLANHETFQEFHQKHFK